MLNESIFPGTSPRLGNRIRPLIRIARQQSVGTYCYAMLAVALLAGWMLRDVGIVDPAEGTGYWLGIVGAAMMAFLLLYPLRKTIKVLRIFGSVKRWFQLHIVIGLLGPLLILYHCNFSLGSFNSRVALYCMLLVACSGIVGRYFYDRIHRGMYGKKTNLRELQDEMTKTMEANHGLATLMPNLISSLEVLSAELQGDEITRSIGVGRSLRWTVKQGLFQFKLRRIAKKDLLERAAESPVIARDIKRLRRTANNYINGYVRLMGRVAQFSLYERLFSLWHVFHMPFFLMLVLSACIHILAVHMY